ncbi:transposase [Singulisphaera acidiphila]|nr:transposase [Singulisphaera acidiphila]
MVFHKAGDYAAFLGAMADATARTPRDLLGYCLMPNHFPLVLRPHADGDLSRWMPWLLTAHARRCHRHHVSARDSQRGGDRDWHSRHSAHRTALGSLPLATIRSFCVATPCPFT